MADVVYENVKRRVRRVLNLDTRRAVLGDANGVVYEPGRVGYVRVTYPASDNNSTGRTFPTVVRLRVNIDTSDVGKPVIVGYDREGLPAVIDVDFTGSETSGRNPIGDVTTTNPLTNNTVDLNYSPILRSQPFGTGAPLYVSVLPFYYIRHRTIHAFSGVDGGIDLSGSRPGTANQWLLAGIFLKSDDTTEVTVSTAQDLAEPLDETDIQECITGSSSGAIPVCMWILRNGQTSIADTDKFFDARQWINVPPVPSSAYTVTNGATDRAYDANATTLDEVADVLYTLITDLQTAGILT